LATAGEAALRRISEERTNFALKAARAGIWELRLRSGEMYWTETLEEIMGVARGNGPRTLDQFLASIDASDRESVRRELQHAIEAKSPDFSTKFAFVCPDGTHRYMEGHGRFVPDANGQPDVLLGVAIDVTERRLTELQLQQAQKMEAIGRLAGGVAHDFNNLLTAILGHAELIMAHVADPGVRADIEEITKAGHRATRLTRQLLAFSRKQRLVPQVLDLNGVVVDLGKMLMRVIGEDIRLEIQTGPMLEHTKVDPVQVEQLLLNLVVNSRDAMPQGGTVRISTANAQIDAEFAQRHQGAVPGRYVTLTVQDYGCGMDRDTLAHAFEPFFTTKGPAKGTGLGLATVYGIVNQSGGYVTIDSTPGVGTTVTAYLPAVAEPLQPVVERSTARALFGNETILLAEDDPSVRTLIVRTLSRHGYQILEARDIAEAIAFARRKNGPIHLLLTDIVMPDMSGPNLAQLVVRDHPDIKVLYVSGFPWSDAAGAAAGSRASFLAKPFTPTALATSVRDCLDG
jgi:two-component system, cell cycle sensor histidine kinase and response regulator CckA